MNVEEFDELINTIPKVESDNPILTMNSINVEDLRNAVKRFKKSPSYQELLKKNHELKLQLKGTTHCYDEEEHKRLQEENQKLKEKIKKIVEYAYGTDMLVCEYEQLCKIAKVE